MYLRGDDDDGGDVPFHDDLIHEFLFLYDEYPNVVWTIDDVDVDGDEMYLN